MPRIVAINEDGLRIGEDHQNARYANGDVEMVLTLRDEGRSYDSISRLMEMPKSTVASYCRYIRRAQATAGWKTLKE